MCWGSLDDTVAFLTPGANSDLSFGSNEEEESPEEDIEVDIKETNANQRQCRKRGGSSRKVQARGEQNRLNNSSRDTDKQLQESKWKSEDKTPVVTTFTGDEV